MPATLRSSRLVLATLFGFLPVFARGDSDLGDFQRNIEHDRAFQREMDAQRARTDAINQPSTFKAPPSQAVSAQAWLDALDEKKRRESEANAARARDYDLRALRAQEAWKKSLKTDTQRMREAMAKVTPEEIARYKQAQPLAEQGISGWDLPIFTAQLFPESNGKYAADSTPEGRAAIAIMLQANAEFRRLRETADYETLNRLVQVLEFGPSGKPDDSAAPVPSFAAHTAFNARRALFLRFPGVESATALRKLCEAWPAWVPMRGIAYASQKEIVLTWAEAVVASGDGESEYLAQSRYRKSARGQILIDDAACVIAVGEAFFRRERPVLDGSLPDEERLKRSTALFDGLLYLAETYGQNQLPKVFEAYLRAFELPQMTPTVLAQAGLVQRLERYPVSVNEVSPAQWKRFAAVRGLAVPSLLKELPQKIDAKNEPGLARIVQLNQSAQSNDAATALRIAYACLRPDGTGIEDLPGLTQAMRIATADSPHAEKDQQLAAFRARAFSAYLRRGLTPSQRINATAKGHEAGIAECSFIYANARIQMATSPEERAAARDIFTRIFDQPLWENRITGLSARDQVGLAWLRETGDPDRRKKAEAVWQQGAARGDATCAAELGVLYTNADSTPEQWKEGRRWLNVAADAGQPLALGRVGYCLFLGKRGYAKDQVGAMPFLRKGLFSRGRDACAYCLGLAAIQGVGMEKNPTEALRWWEIGKGYGDAATMEIASAYAEGAGTPQDFPKAIALMLPVAERGNDRAQLAVGTWIYRDKDPAHPASESRLWWERAAQQGNFVAARNLYATELRRSQDATVVANALDALEAFLEKQPAETQYAGGLLLLNETMPFKENVINREKAKRWIERASSRDFALASGWLKTHPF